MHRRRFRCDCVQTSTAKAFLPEIRRTLLGGAALAGMVADWSVLAFACWRSLVGAMPKLPIGFIDRSKQAAKTRRFLDRPEPVERWSQNAYVMTGKQSDRHDPLIVHGPSRFFSYLDQ